MPTHYIMREDWPLKFFKSIISCPISNLIAIEMLFRDSDISKLKLFVNTPLEIKITIELVFQH